MQIPIKYAGITTFKLRNGITAVHDRAATIGIARKRGNKIKIYFN